MGAVYEAEDRRTGVHVAVKVMHGDHIKRDTTRVGRFQREAKAAAAIDSDHIARVLDWGMDDVGAPFIVMEMLVGEDLQELLKRVGALRPEVALRVAAQACIGLAKAHEAHVMHRDIKPANLFLARLPGGEVVVKILDFGVAKIRPEGEQGQETTGLTRTGGMIGSPMYMSPEQARGLKAIDFRTDLWSLGVVLYRALTGHTPHEDTEALGDLIVSLCSRPPKPIQDIARWVPPAIAAVAHGALQIAPEARFTDAQAMLDAMRRLLPHGDRADGELAGAARRGEPRDRRGAPHGDDGGSVGARRGGSHAPPHDERRATSGGDDDGRTERADGRAGGPDPGPAAARAVPVDDGGAGGRDRRGDRRGVRGAAGELAGGGGRGGGRGRGELLPLRPRARPRSRRSRSPRTPPHPRGA